MDDWTDITTKSGSHLVLNTGPTESLKISHAQVLEYLEYLRDQDWGEVCKTLLSRPIEFHAPNSLISPVMIPSDPVTIEVNPLTISQSRINSVFFFRNGRLLS